MRIDTQPHLQQPWRVHTLASDFELLDVWELAIDGEPNLERLVDIMADHGSARDGRIVGALFALRALLGRWFSWDREVERPIPGCEETTLCDRLSEDDRRLSCKTPGTTVPFSIDEVRYVYAFEEEVLFELSNATIHALIHLSWARSHRPRLAVYIKSRGVGSRIYMAAIEPFRQWFVYPAMTKQVAQRWLAE